MIVGGVMRLKKLIAMTSAVNAITHLNAKALKIRTKTANLKSPSKAITTTCYNDHSIKKVVIMAQRKQQKNNRKKRTATNAGRQTRASTYGYDLTGRYSNGNTNVDYWAEAGYRETITFFQHWNMQARFGVAKAGVMRLPDKCWQTSPTITDGDNDGERSQTDFEKDLDVLIKKHHLFQRLRGCDWRNRVGRYAGIIPIVKETNADSKPNTPLSGLRGIESVLKLVPVFESQIDTTDVNTVNDFNSESFGMPTHYNYRENVEGDRNPINNAQFELDPSRVFVFAEGADDGSIYGIPSNEAGFNSLMDLEIICAAGQIGLRKNAKQRFVSNVNDPKVAAVLTNDEKARAVYDKNVDDFNNGGSSNLTVYGMDITALQSDISDPLSPFNNSLNAYAASINIPASEIIGVQMNKQASTGNADAFNETAQSRCENTLTPFVVGFLMYLVKIGAMRPPKDEIKIEWADLSEPSTGEKMDVGNKMMDINKKARESSMSPVYTEQQVAEATGHEFNEGLEFEEDDELEIEE